MDKYSTPVEINGLSHRYGDVAALADVDLNLEPGQLLALLGPNGAGKTTLLSCLLGLLKPRAGSLRVFGQPSLAPAARRLTGVMLQNSGVPVLLSVTELVELFRSYHAEPLPAARVFSDAGIESLSARRFGTLSGGQKQQVLFALALIGRPRLLLLDEPSNGMDIHARARLWRTVGQLRDGGTAVLLTTHYLEEADRLADDVVVLEKGRVVASGTQAKIKARLGGARLSFRSALPRAQVESFCNGASIESNGERYSLWSPAPEIVLRPLLAADPELSELEVQPARLEDALAALSDESNSHAKGT